MKRLWPILLAAAACAQLPPGESEPNPHLTELLTIRRVFVEPLAGGDSAVPIRDMLISALQNARLFRLTEDKAKADAILRGSAEDLIFTDTLQESEGLQARTQIGSSRSGASTRGGASFQVGEQESIRMTERKHEAMASVRLVNKDGDVIWSTTQESLGAKFRGASADVAAKVTRQLADDFARAKRATRVP